ncbi:unnamed protein product [Cunninghamella blakesleeana]
MKIVPIFGYNLAAPHYVFFTEIPLSEWSVNNFIKYENNKKPIGKPKSVLIKSFYHCLKRHILKDSSAPTEVQCLVKKKAESEQSTVFHGDIYGGVIGNRVNIEIITTTNNIISLIKSKNSSHINIDHPKVPKISWRRKEISQYAIKLSKTD